MWRAEPATTQSVPAAPPRSALAWPHRTSESAQPSVVLRCAELPTPNLAERFDGVLARYARRTSEATELLTAFALQAGGEGGARLAQKAGVPISPDTLLRLLQMMSDPPVPTP